jgi:hypothetical protein
MVCKLGHLVNKPVLVSIPRIFAGAEPHPCRLVGLEAAGLWLESADLSGTTIPNTKRLPARVFVPFAQIAYLVEAPPLVPPAVRRANTPRLGRIPFVKTEEKKRR